MLPLFQYSNLTNVALGTYLLPDESERHIHVHLEEYTQFDVSKDDTHYNLDLRVITSKFILMLVFLL